MANLKQFATATLWEVSPDVQSLEGLRPLFTPIELCGPAYTVEATPGDNLPIHRALAEAPRGSVLVVATGGDTDRGWWGEVLMEAALARGIAGLVIDGSVRDTRLLRGKRFPIFSAGIAIPGTTKSWSGILNRPLTLGQVTIHPGDIIVGDDDGVLVVPTGIADEVGAKAQVRTEEEAALMQRLREGELTLDLLDLRNLNRERP